MSNTNPWKYVEIDEGELKTNPYLNPPQRMAPTPATSPVPSVDTVAPVTVANLNDFLVLYNLSCVDADGNTFESYPELRVKKDIFRDSARQQVNRKPYDAAVHCEKNGLFLPSFALTCNIVIALYKNRTNPEAEALLQQYKNHGAGHGYQAQNTIINYATQEIVHYPSAADFNQTAAINAGRRKTGNFAKATLQDCSLEDALKDAVQTRYAKQLTGLADPKGLVEIGRYFGRPARLWFPWSGQVGTTFTDKRAAWFGCGSGGYLSLIGSGGLGYDGAARGVRLGAP